MRGDNEKEVQEVIAGPAVLDHANWGLTVNMKIMKRMKKIQITKIIAKVLT